MFLEDRQFIERVESCIRSERLSLESAIQVTIDELVNILEAADNSYLRERSADIRDLQRRLQRHIAPPAREQLAKLAPRIDSRRKRTAPIRPAGIRPRSPGRHHHGDRRRDGACRDTRPGARHTGGHTEYLFRVQIRAALHTAIGHDVRIMLPMVLGAADLRHAVSIIRDVADKDGISDPPPIGTLVETPSAVFAIEEILAVSDFVSIGTNDLTQFILAADRTALQSSQQYSLAALAQAALHSDSHQTVTALISDALKTCLELCPSTAVV